MSKPHPRQLFLDRPWSSALLTLFLILLGCAFIAGWVQDSPNRRYFPGHHWFMASLSWVTAVYFAYCAGKGFLIRSRRNQK